MSGRRRGPVRLPEDPEELQDKRRRIRRALEFLAGLAGDLAPGDPMYDRTRRAVREMRNQLDTFEAAFGEEALAEERELVERVAAKLDL